MEMKNPNQIPDDWKILKITLKSGETNYFIAAGWAGGYTQGRSWKISSGVDGIVHKTEDYVDFHNKSGSVYRCYFDREGLDWYTTSIIKSYKTEHERVGDIFELIDYVAYNP